MDTISRAASAASDAILRHHGQHGQHSEHGTTTHAKSSDSHEPISGQMGETEIGEPYDAGNLDEASQQRIAASRGTEQSTTTTTQPTATTHQTTTTHPTTTETTETTGTISPPRRSSDVSPRSGPSVAYPTTATGHGMTEGRTGATGTTGMTDTTGTTGTTDPTDPTKPSYSSARDTATRAMTSAEIDPTTEPTTTLPPTTGPSSTTPAGLGMGSGMWTSGTQPSRDIEPTRTTGDALGIVSGDNKMGTEAVESTGAEHETQHARIRGAEDLDATGAQPPSTSTTTTADAPTKRTSLPSSASAPGFSAPSDPSAAHHGDDSADGAPLQKRSSLTGHLPGAPGGEGLRRTSVSEGTGEKYVKSSGLKADGGDFDARNPGAGREAGRLLTEKGVHRPTSGVEDKVAKGQTDPKAPSSSNNLSGATGSGEKLGVKDKIKQKLHVGGGV